MWLYKFNCCVYDTWEKGLQSKVGQYMNICLDHSCYQFVVVTYFLHQFFVEIPGLQLFLWTLKAMILMPPEII